MPSQTSIQNYHEHKRSGKLGAQEQRILDFLAKYPNQNFSRSELARELDLPLASVCGRVNSLVDLRLVTERPKRACNITKKQISPVRIKREETKEPELH